jgi:FkbM family methyltransferase
MFIEKIRSTENAKIQYVNELKSSSIPLIMYGAGSYALDVSKFLLKQGIKVNSYCVDTLYYKENQFVNNIPVLSIEKVCNQIPKMNMVIGFADYKKATQKVKQYKNVKNLYFIDAPHSLEFLDYAYIEMHKDQFQKTFELLEDQKSRDVFIAYINSKIKGLPDELYDLAEFNPYFPEIIKLTDTEVFIDCGAYDGDTIVAFNNRINGRYKKIIAFEPDDLNFTNLIKTIRSNDFKNVEVVKKGCWEKTTKLCFSSDGNMTSQVQDNGGVYIDVEAIDTVAENDIVTFIKMDIEGSELQALKGASSIIRKNKPKLAICVYHKPEDLIEIPQYIKSLVPEYKLYLRHHQYISWEMVLYAVI